MKNTAEIAVLMGMIGGPAAAIASLENSNRTELLASGTNVRLPMPTGSSADAEQAILKEWGVDYGLPDERSTRRGKALFHHATIPAGWSIKPTDHYLYSHLHDNNGLVRAQMYHAQDSDSWISLRRRFNYGTYRDSWTDRDALEFPAIYDEAKTIYWRGAFIPGEPSKFDSGRYAQVLALCRAKNHMKALAAYGVTGDDAKHIASRLADTTLDSQSGFIEVHGPKELRDPGKCGAEYARTVLNKAYPDYGNVRAYWDVLKPEFPPNQSEKPKGESYDMAYSLYDGDRFCDSSFEPCVVIAETDEQALKKYEKILKDSFVGRYDVKNITVRCGSRIVKKWDIVRPRKFEEAYDCFGNQGLFRRR